MIIIKRTNRSAFTLIELLIVIMIIGLLVTIAIFAARQAQSSARDARRKADLEQIRTALEYYHNDCNNYPAALGSSITGTGAGTCNGNYMQSVPVDPQSPARSYYYNRPTAQTYVICSSLEDSTDPTPSGCGSCGSSCNYKVISP